MTGEAARALKTVANEINVQGYRLKGEPYPDVYFEFLNSAEYLRRQVEKHLTYNYLIIII